MNKGRRSFLQAIETQRRRLDQAESVLSCLADAMEHSDGSVGKRGAYFADVVDVARELVVEACHQLDSVNLSRAKAAKENAGHELVVR